MAVNNIINTNNLPLDITTGTGAFNLGTDITVKTIQIGNNGASGPTTITFDAGTGALTIGDVGINSSVVNFGIDSGSTSAVINLDAGTGAMNISSTAQAQNVAFLGAQINFYTGTGGILFPCQSITTAPFSTTGGKYLVANNGAQNTFSLINSAGKFSRITGNGSNGWKITQLAGQQIFSTAAATTSGTGGSLSSGGRYDSVELFCQAVNVFIISGFKGTLVFV